LLLHSARRRLLSGCILNAMRHVSVRRATLILFSHAAQFIAA
jgi:hypothetical protein